MFQNKRGFDIFGALHVVEIKCKVNYKREW